MGAGNGCLCVYIDGQCDHTQGRCDGGVCVYNGDTGELALRTKISAKHPWLYNLNQPWLMSQKAGTPKALEILKTIQTTELAEGVADRDMLKYVDSGWANIQVRVSGQTQTISIWVNPSNLQAKEWIASHPDPDERFIITPTTWQLVSRETLKDRGTVPAPLDLTKCKKTNANKISTEKAEMK